MFEVDSLDKIPQVSAPCVLTIGSFDGVHLGHLALLSRARKLAGAQGTLAVLTFSNHPAEFLTPHTSIPKLTSLEEKASLLKQAGVDLLITLPFTQTLSQLSPKEFLSTLKNHLPFSYLILGQGARLGYNRQGDEAHIQALQTPLSFTVEYLPKTTICDEIVSSGRIRKHLADGDLSKASDLLGRPYHNKKPPKVL